MGYNGLLTVLKGPGIQELQCRYRKGSYFKAARNLPIKYSSPRGRAMGIMAKGRLLT